MSRWVRWFFDRHICVTFSPADLFTLCASLAAILISLCVGGVR